MPTDEHFRILLEPQKWVPELEESLSGGTTLEILSEGAELEDGIEALEGWVATFKDLGFIPDDGLDWRSRAPIDVIRRMSRRTFYIRTDAFEAETETGYINGYGYLKLVRRPN